MDNLVLAFTPVRVSGKATTKKKEKKETALMRRFCCTVLTERCDIVSAGSDCLKCVFCFLQFLGKVSYVKAIVG